MGFFKKIKNMFSKNIDCVEELEGKFFYLNSTKGKEVKVGANIIVPEGFFAVFVCKDKVCDVVLNGKFAINGANLPKTFSIMKLGKSNKNGKYKKKFNADIYFISRDYQRDLEFCSFDKYVNKSERLGKVKAYSMGLFDVQIDDAEKLLKYFISERPYVAEELFLDLLSGLVGNYVNRKLELLYNDFLDIVINPKQVNEKLNSVIEMERYFDDYGFKLCNVRFESLNVSTKLKNKVEEILKLEKGLNNQINQQLKIEVPAYRGDNCEEEKTEVSIKTTCNRCGQQVSDSAVFCEKCGNRLNNLN